MTRYNQNDIRVPTDYCTRDTQGVEGGNNISRIRMNPQKDDIIIKLEWKQYTEDKVYPWRLEN